MMVTVVFYGAFLLTLTGITMIFACVTFHVLQPRLPFRILGSDVDFVTYYGPCFWAVLIIGECFNKHLYDIIINDKWKHLFYLKGLQLFIVKFILFSSPFKALLQQSLGLSSCVLTTKFQNWLQNTY